MFFSVRFAILLLALCASSPLLAQPRYQLEKVVMLSRHGIRPPTPDARKEIEAATQRRWPVWQTADGELTRRGYAALVNAGRWQGEHYRQLGLLSDTCPATQTFYVRASPLQRTRASARALAEGAFPGCRLPIYVRTTGKDPLFQSDTSPDAQQLRTAVMAKAGNLAARRAALLPAINALKKAVCRTETQCAGLDRPWQIRQSRSGDTYITGLSVLASSTETLRLGWNENLPPEQQAWGHLRQAAQISALLPLQSLNDELSNGVIYGAQKRASTLLATLLQAISGKPTSRDIPETRWLLLVAHDTSISMVRALMNFSGSLPGYASGNVPPGSSLVLERWRDTRNGQPLLRVYFQAQSLEDIRLLRPVSQAHPLLSQSWQQAGCRTTTVGTLCPLKRAVRALSLRLDRQAIVPVGSASALE